MSQSFQADVRLESLTYKRRQAGKSNLQGVNHGGLASQAGSQSAEREQKYRPEAQAGKDRSRFNALDHGCRAESLILPGEDPQALEERQAAWSACLLPQDEIEAYI